MSLGLNVGGKEGSGGLRLVVVQGADRVWTADASTPLETGRPDPKTDHAAVGLHGRGPSGTSE